MMMFESNGGDRSAGGGGGGSVGGGGNMQRVEKGLGRLMEVLWSSGCLEACVYILGEVPDSARYGMLSLWGFQVGGVYSCM